MNRVLVLCAVAAVLCPAVFASPASASLSWKFDGETLAGEEVVIGSASEVQLTIEGLTTSCDIVYSMNISNAGGMGSGEITYLPVFNCATDFVCTVTASTAEELPWAVSLREVSGEPYVVIEGIELTIAYGNQLCALDEIEAEYEGSAGGYFDNGSSLLYFSPTSFSATGTEVQVFGVEVEVNAVLSAEAFGPHLGEALTVG